VTFVRESLVGIPQRRLGTPTKGKARALGLEHSPVGLWKLDEDLSDDSGNFFDLSVDTGTELYTEMLPRLRGLFATGTGAFTVGSYQAALGMTGDMTLQFIFSSSVLITSSIQMILHHSNNSEAEGDNLLYSMRLLTSNEMQYFAEQGAGTDIQYSNGIALAPGAPTLVQLVRSSNEVSFYLNGQLKGATSSGLSAPTGGTTGFFYLGNNSGTAWFGTLASVKLVNSALSAADLVAEYDRSLGPVYGFRGGTDVTPAQLTSDVNDYNPAGFETASVVRLSSDATRTITGFYANGQDPIVNEKYLVNVGNNDIVLAQQSASSGLDNRIISHTNSNFTLGAGESIGIFYDENETRWWTFAS
jgi:hypothetical protein